MKNRLQEYLMKEVATGNKPNPWLAKPLAEASIRKHLRRYIKYYIITALVDSGIENTECTFNVSKSRSVIQSLNKQLVASLVAAGSFPSDIVKSAITNCKKFWVNTAIADSMLPIESKGKFNRCLVAECEFHAKSTRLFYICLEGGAYSNQLEMPEGEEAEKPPKLICLCLSHIPLYELMFTLMHMDWNVYHNCLHVVKETLASTESRVFGELMDAIPKNVYKGLALHYLSRYHMMWAFGEQSDWQSRGFTLYQQYASWKDKTIKALVVE